MCKIEFKNVSFLYNNKKILDNISFVINSGDFVSIIGKNGSGKSILTRHINGLLLPSFGDVFVDGMSTKNNKNVYNIRRKVGFMFQDPDEQIVAGTVEEDIAFGLSNLGIKREIMREKIDRVLKKLGIFEYKSCDVNRLSGGTKQKLILAGILAMDSECLILDEPTSMIDPESCDIIINELIKLNKNNNITVILLTHHMNEAQKANKIFLLDSGKIIAQGDKNIITKYFINKNNLNIINFNNNNKINININKKENICLEFVNISYKYNKTSDFVIKNINLKIFKNEIIGIIGKTGSGKSTFAKIIKGIIKPNSGEILFNNKIINNLDFKNKIGIVFQSPENQLFAETVLKDVSFGPQNLGFSKTESEKKSVEILNFLGFNKNKINNSPFELSGGEKRLVAIAGILAMEPEILVFDEPTAGLDLFAINNFLNLIFKLHKNQNKTIIIISHSYNEIKLISDRIFFIKNKQLFQINNL